MSRTKDCLCVVQHQPTLHDMLEIMGLSHNPERTTRAIIQRYKVTPVMPSEETVPQQGGGTVGGEGSGE